MVRGERVLPLEEQALPRYHAKHYYPVRIGQVFNNRYRIITKLGYGAFSTFWLARDERTTQYASIKVCNHDDTNSSSITNEVKILQHLANCPQVHAGAMVARLADEIFEVDSRHGTHQCIVTKPQGCNFVTLQHIFHQARLPKEFIMDAVQRLLACINWLHLDCGVIHTEITAQNVLMQANDKAIFEPIEDQEFQDPSIVYVDGTHPVYPSRGEPTSILELNGESVLTDFGSARLSTANNRGWWMPDTHRAPEVLMGLPWGCQVDVWSIGVMALELLEVKNLFNPIDKMHNQYVLPLALSQYISYLGPPPLWMIQKSENPIIATFFDENGQWNSEPSIPSQSLEDFVTAIPPGSEKTRFLNFVRRMLTWDPSTRAYSSDLFSDEWLMGSSET